MRRIEVVKVGQIKASCNICFAHNYVPHDKTCEIGEYTPDIFNVFLGGVNGTLCRNCLEALGLAALNVSVGGKSCSYGPNHEE